MKRFENLRSQFGRFAKRHPDIGFKCASLGLGSSLAILGLMSGNLPLSITGCVMVSLDAYRIKLNAKKTYMLADKDEVYEMNIGQSIALSRLSSQMNDAIGKKLGTTKTDKAHAKLNTRLDKLAKRKEEILQADNVRKIKAPQNI
ncbi:MAG: hypothetical protein ACQEQL_06720 [Pseudomonadota bacterium]